MILPKRIDLVSAFTGALAIPAAFVATYLQSIREPGSGVVLRWLVKMGLVHEPSAADPIVRVVRFFPNLESFGLVSGPVVTVSGVPEMTEASMFSVNDENAIYFAISIAALLALVAMATSLWAEYRRKPTLYLGCGYICGALAIALIRPLAGFAFLIGGITAVLILRNQNET